MKIFKRLRERIAAEKKARAKKESRELDKFRRIEWYKKYALYFRHQGPAFPLDVSFDNTDALVRFIQSKTTAELYAIPGKTVRALGDKEAKKSWQKAGESWARAEFAKEEALKRFKRTNRQPRGLK